MRKLLTAAVAVTLMGLGVSSVHATTNPLTAVYMAAPLLGETPQNHPGYNADENALDAGSQLAGLVHAYQLGVTSVGTEITNLSTAIELQGNPVYGAEAYGLAVAGTATPLLAPTAAATVTTFYTAGYQTGLGFIAYQAAPGTPAGSSIQQYANYIGSVSGDPTVSPTSTAEDNQLLYDLSYHVLATNTLGLTAANAAFSSTLISELGHFNTAFTSTGVGNDRAAGYTDPTTILALALWSLKESGVDTATTSTPVGDTFGGKTLDQLEALLKSDLSTEINTDHVAYVEDLSYGILALQAFGESSAVIDPLKALLATAVGASTGATPPPGAVVQAVGSGVDYSNIGANNVFAGAALQALPEPASLSLFGLSGLALMARRRRRA